MDSNAYENKRSANVVSRKQSDWKIVAMQRYCFKGKQNSLGWSEPIHANYMVPSSGGEGKTLM